MLQTPQACKSAATSGEHFTYFKAYGDTWDLWSLLNEIVESNSVTLSFDDLQFTSGFGCIAWCCRIQDNLSGKAAWIESQSVEFPSQARGLMAETLDMLAQKGKFHLSCELQGKLASRGFTDIISRGANGEKDMIAALYWIVQWRGIHEMILHSVLLSWPVQNSLFRIERGQIFLVRCMNFLIKICLFYNCKSVWLLFFIPSSLTM